MCKHSWYYIYVACLTLFSSVCSLHLSKVVFVSCILLRWHYYLYCALTLCSWNFVSWYIFSLLANTKQSSSNGMFSWYMISAFMSMSRSHAVFIRSVVLFQESPLLLCCAWRYWWALLYSLLVLSAYYCGGRKLFYFPQLLVIKGLLLF